MQLQECNKLFVLYIVLKMCVDQVHAYFDSLIRKDVMKSEATQILDFSASLCVSLASTVVPFFLRTLDLNCTIFCACQSKHSTFSKGPVDFF